MTLQLTCVNGLRPAPFNLTCLKTINLDSETFQAKKQSKQSLIKKATILFITDSLNPENFNEQCK